MADASLQVELPTLLHYPPPIAAVTPDATADVDADDVDISRLLFPRGDEVKGVSWLTSGCQEDTCSSRSVLVTAPDLPTQYTVHGLYADELPVIGTYVDPSITPGFRYRTRVLGQRPRPLFSNQALCLQSVGRGYGKRITFESDSDIHNDNYFYSDSSEAGFGFSLVAVAEGDAFMVCDQEGYAVGQGTVHQVGLQKETGTIVEDGAVLKQVSVDFSCEVRYGAGKHGLVPLCSLKTLHLHGTALVVRQAGSRRAVTEAITNINLPNYGACRLTFASQPAQLRSL